MKKSSKMVMKFVRMSTAANVMTAPTQKQFVRKLLALTPSERLSVAQAVEAEVKQS
jgi:16S rRNA A1518/A1519 N6-dimethyltransferase RsmA/KsgA/DIM1 with predicted DNA glycosylase/AP lyase activity